MDPFSASAVTMVSTVTPFWSSLTLADSEMGSSGLTACLTLSDEQLVRSSAAVAAARIARKFTTSSYVGEPTGQNQTTVPFDTPFRPCLPIRASGPGGIRARLTRTRRE